MTGEQIIIVILVGIPLTVIAVLITKAIIRWIFKVNTNITLMERQNKLLAMMLKQQGYPESELPELKENPTHDANGNVIKAEGWK